MQGVVPMLSYEDAAAAVAWLERVFGFRERADVRISAPDGGVAHAELDTGGGTVMVADAPRGYQGPRRHEQDCDRSRRWRESPWVINGVLVIVPDIDTHYARSRSGGANLLSEVEDAPPGRLYRVEDLEGQRWMFLQPRN